MRTWQERAIVDKLILARELGRQGYRWNQAFRKELWKRLQRHELPNDPQDDRPGEGDEGEARPGEGTP